MQKIIDIENLQKRTGRCRRCGRKLKKNQYAILGYGKICYKKIMEERNRMTKLEIGEGVCQDEE